GAATVEAAPALRRLDPRRAPREARPTEPGGELLREVERGADLGLRLAPLRLAVREPRAAADDRAVEERLPARRQLDGDAEPVDMRPEAAEVVRELGREHRRH